MSDSPQDPRAAPPPEHDYLRDIRDIRDLLLRADQRPIYERWAFPIWGALVASGSIAHYLLARSDLTPLPVAAIWIPLAAVAGLVELVTTVRTMNRTALTILSRSVLRYVFTLVGGSAAFALVAALLARVGASTSIPLVLVLGVAFFFMALAQSTDVGLYVQAFALLLLAAVLFALDVRGPLAVLVGGSGIAVAFASAGLTIRRP